MAAETQLKKPEKLVQMVDYTMDEAQVMFDYCGVVIEDFAPLMDEADDAERDARMDERLKNPAFVRALLHIAYQRANPRATDDEVRRFFGAMTRNEALERFNELVGTEAEDETVPLELTTEQEPSSPKSSVTNNEPSGEPSTPSSDEPGDPAETTGTPV